jgi:hypothetical protein
MLVAQVVSDLHCSDLTSTYRQPGSSGSCNVMLSTYLCMPLAHVDSLCLLPVLPVLQ